MRGRVRRSATSAGGPAARPVLSPGPAGRMPTREAPVSDDCHQQNHDTQPCLHPTGEPGRIDHLDQVVRDESAAVPGLSGPLAQVVLQQRERADEAS